MKKLFMAVGVGLISGSLWAACTGPFCYDDTGASINGLGYDGNGISLPLVSSVTVRGITARSKGQVVLCTNCVGGNTGVGVICVSTAATLGSFVLVSTASALTACQ